MSLYLFEACFAIYSRPADLTWKAVLKYCMIFLFIWCSIFSPAFAESPVIVRLGFSESILDNVNKNDVLAATRVWTTAFADESGITVDMKDILILSGLNEIREALVNHSVDYMSLSIDEYAEVKSLLDFSSIYVSQISNSLSEEYLLVVSGTGKIESLSDLKGRKLNILTNARTSLARVWVDTLLLKEGLGTAGEYFAEIKSIDDANKTLLPVFFGTVDACIVTKNGFKLMAELNPQVEKRLKIIAVSPPVVPSFFCFSPNADKKIMDKVSYGLTRWHLTNEGKQSLTMFKADSIKESSVAILEPSLKLINEHKQLLKENNSHK